MAGMKILVTGANGFVGRNLVEYLKTIQEGKNKTRPNLDIMDIYEFDRNTDPACLDRFCRDADFVFHLAGVNRPKESSEFMEGNLGTAAELLGLLKKHQNVCPVMLSSSIQAALTGRYRGSEYGKSKLAGEKLFFKYAQETGAKVLVYRFPNLFGKWCRPNYNSAVATFCNAIANDLDYVVNDRNTELELLYIDDLVHEMLDALEGREHRCDYDEAGLLEEENGPYCFVPVTEKKTLGEIVDLLMEFRSMPMTLEMPEFPVDSFLKKLYSAYLSYLPERRVSYPLKRNEDGRGVFAELIRTKNCGQVSVNIVKPGQVRGRHWHNSKWEIFIVVSGHGRIQEQRIGADGDGKPYPVMEFEVTGEEMRAVQMLPGYTHKVQNLSSVQDLVMVIWANEAFDPSYPDTYFQDVNEERYGEDGFNLHVF